MVRYAVYKLRKGELGGAGFRQKRSPTVFVAYRFGDAWSKRFRVDIEMRLRRPDATRHLSVIDGHTDVGRTWPKEIRERMTRARLVVADLTTLSPEVLFECGYAYGLAKPILPVVEEHSWIARLPRWLTDLQVGDMSAARGWSDLVDSIARHAGDRGKGRHALGPPKPDPGVVVWVKGPEWFESLHGHVSQTADRCGLALPRVVAPAGGLAAVDASAMAEVARAWLLVAPLSNTPADSFVHFALGVMAAAPMAGAARPYLARRALVVVPSSIRVEEVLAESASRMTPLVSGLHEERLASMLSEFQASHRSWQRAHSREPK
jgi:hypothetical protein